MKKMYFEQILGFLNGLGEMTEEVRSNLISEVEKEINKGAEEKARNNDLYEAAKVIVMDELAVATEAVTIGELWEAVADKMPEGFTKGKLQYAVTRLWVNDLVKVEGKVNSYRKA